MKVIVSVAAKADLREIGDFIASDSRKAAARVTKRLLANVRSLARTPERYPAVQAGRDVRKCVVPPHVIFYRVESTRVVVLRIVHGARDFAPIVDLL